MQTMAAHLPLRTQLSLSRPLSYFVALRSRQQIFAKIDGPIEHKRSDHYCRCLLQLPAAQLQHVLADMEGKSDQWYKEHLCIEDVGDDADQLDDGVGDSGQAALLALPEPDLPGVFAPIVAGAEWVRCWVSLGGDRRYKVYFDNCTGGSGHRRGFSNCSHHGCIIYRPTYGSRLEFAVAMCLWHEHAFENEILRADHLRFWPAEEHVQNAMPSARLENF